MVFKWYQLIFSILLIKSINGKKQWKDGSFVDKKGRRFRGTCDNHHEKACQWNRHCPGQCDDNSLNAGDFCKNPIDCPQGSCIHNQCVKPIGSCANNIDLLCNKNKDCKPHVCIIPTGVCDNDSSVTCKGRIDCPSICTEESENAGTPCSKHWKCGKNGRCGRGHCVVPPETAAPSGTPSLPITPVPSNITSINPDISSSTMSPIPSPPCPPPGLENVINTYEECLCFYSLAASGLDVGDPSTFETVFNDDSVMEIAQTGKYYGLDGIAEYLSFVSNGVFILNYTEIGLPIPLNMTFSSSTGQCISTFAGRRRMPFNPVYIENNQDVCVDVVAGTTLYYTMTEKPLTPITIQKFNSWYPDEFMKSTMGFSVHTAPTAEYVCDVLVNSCNGTMSMEQCIADYNALPKYDVGALTYVDGNSQGCRTLHAFFAATNEKHCPHVSFEADEDINGFVKCNESKGALETDLFTPQELGQFYFASNFLGLGNLGYEIKMESCYPKDSSCSNEDNTWSDISQESPNKDVKLKITSNVDTDTCSYKLSVSFEPNSTYPFLGAPTAGDIQGLATNADYNQICAAEGLYQRVYGTGPLSQDNPMSNNKHYTWYNFHLDVPPLTKEKIGFKHIALDAGPCGSLMAPYPHYSIHFYDFTKEERESMVCATNGDFFCLPMEQQCSDSGRKMNMDGVGIPMCEDGTGYQNVPQNYTYLIDGLPNLPINFANPTIGLHAIDISQASQVIDQKVPITAYMNYDRELVAYNVVVWAGFAEGHGTNFQRDYTSYNCQTHDKSYYPTSTTVEYVNGTTAVSIAGPIIDCSGDSFSEEAMS